MTVFFTVTMMVDGISPIYALLPLVAPVIAIGLPAVNFL